MECRRFGRLGWSVAEIGYGLWGMGGWSGSNDDESLAALDRAVALGCNFFDTAWAYGQGRSERLLGQTLRAHADRRLYVATKVPPKNMAWPKESQSDGSRASRAGGIGHAPKTVGQRPSRRGRCLVLACPVTPKPKAACRGRSHVARSPGDTAEAGWGRKP